MIKDTDAMDGNVMHMLGELKGMLGSLVARFDAAEAARLRDLELVHSRMDKHDVRITALETTKNQATGAALATKIIVPLVWGLVITFSGLVAYLLSPFLGSIFGG